MTTNDPAWQGLLDEAATKLGLKISSYCTERNKKESPRYFHADVVSVQQPESKWRLKVVNIRRNDQKAVRDCNSYNNAVHARLIKADALKQVVRIPQRMSPPSPFCENYNVSELIDGNALSIDDFELIVDVLVNLQSNRGDIIRQLETDDSTIPRKLDKPDYRARLEDSLRGLADCVESDRIQHAFKMRWFTNGIPATIQTFAHGDFSFGNLKLVGRALALIDFEHSHIGLGCVDMAHLYVNLFADGQAKAATILRNLYKTRFLKRGFWFEDSVFEALVIERAAGKMNSIKDRSTEKFETLKHLLSSLS